MSKHPFNINALRNRLLDTGDYDESELKDLTPYELFDKWLHYYGIIGWTSDIIEQLSNATGKDLFSLLGTDY